MGRAPASAPKIRTPNPIALTCELRQSVAMPNHLTMSSIRKEIDRIDESLVKLLAERQRWVEKAIDVKHRDGFPARDQARIDKVVDNARILARAHRLDPALAEAIWTEMVEWFVAHEERTLDRR